MSSKRRVVFVTGATGGIGRAVAVLMAGRGADVALAGRRAEPLAVVAEQCEAVGASVFTLDYDQRESASVRAAVNSAAEHFGRIDVQVNVAGVSAFGRVADTSDEMWNEIIGVNLTGVFYCCRSVLPIMARLDSACIVNIASGAAYLSRAAQGAYSASKAGLIAFSRSLAREVAPRIRVNVVAPGPIDTGIVHVEPPEGPFDSLDSIPMGRKGLPSEVAEVVEFLCSHRAAFVTGQTYHVNGGRLML